MAQPRKYLLLIGTGTIVFAAVLYLFPQSFWIEPLKSKHVLGIGTVLAFLGLNGESVFTNRHAHTGTSIKASPWQKNFFVFFGLFRIGFALILAWFLSSKLSFSGLPSRSEVKIICAILLLMIGGVEVLMMRKGDAAVANIGRRKIANILMIILALGIFVL